MGRYNLSEGVHKTGNYIKELWKAFKNVFLLRHKTILVTSLYFTINYKIAYTGIIIKQRMLSFSPHKLMRTQSIGILVLKRNIS